MKIYIDFDGVILDTDKTIDEECNKLNINKKEYINNCDWKALLNNSFVINDSLKYLKESNLDISLLSKISTLNEGISKVNFLRKHNISMNIHLVPNVLFKNDIVNALGNILIDDKIYNLDKWTEAGGIGIFFNKDNKNIDIYGKINTQYKTINSLDLIMKEINL